MLKHYNAIYYNNISFQSLHLLVIELFDHEKNVHNVSYNEHAVLNPENAQNISKCALSLVDMHFSSLQMSETVYLIQNYSVHFGEKTLNKQKDSYEVRLVLTSSAGGIDEI